MDLNEKVAITTYMSFSKSQDLSLREEMMKI